MGRDLGKRPRLSAWRITDRWRRLIVLCTVASKQICWWQKRLCSLLYRVVSQARPSLVGREAGEGLGRETTHYEVVRLCSTQHSTFMQSSTMIYNQIYLFPNSTVITDRRVPCPWMFWRGVAWDQRIFVAMEMPIFFFFFLPIPVCFMCQSVMFANISSCTWSCSCDS